MNKTIQNWNIKEHCIFPKSKPEFVGLKIKNNDIKFVFPNNYYTNKAEKNNIPEEDELKKDIIKLLHYINKYKIEQKINDKESNDIPILSYLWIIQNFISRGYYTEIEAEYKKTNTGKIDWKKTINYNDIYIGANDIIFRNFIIKSSKINKNNIITAIHKKCVYESINKFGWYYNILHIEKPEVDIPNEICINILKEECAKTFLDTKKLLFKHMINIFEGLGSNSNATEFEIITYNFEYIFERLVEENFGTEDTTDYLPTAEWKIMGRGEGIKASKLRPDSIMKYESNVYILDAKYYQYGYTNNVKDLPDTSSIQKQVTYAEQMEKYQQECEKNNEFEKIYNIFLLPYCSEDENYLKYIGYAETSWKSKEKEYEKVHTILVDIKKLINNPNFIEKHKRIESLVKCLNEGL